MSKISKIFIFLLAGLCLIVVSIIVGLVMELDIFADSVFASSSPGGVVGVLVDDVLSSGSGSKDDWQEYRSESYGFQIKFPEIVSPKDVYNRKGLNAGVGNKGTTPIWKFQLEDPRFYEGTNLLDASLIINISTDPEQVAACSQSKGSSLKQSGGQVETPSVVEINGIRFWQDEDLEGAMGQSYHTIRYRTVRHDACYELTVLMHYQNIQGYATDGISAFSKDQVRKILSEIVSTFEFLDVIPTFTAQELPSSSPGVTNKSLDAAEDDYADGIDVSHWQGDINWGKVAGAGYSFAFAKASEGVGWTDVYFHTNTQEGTSAGVLMGAYHYARPDLNNTGEEEAEWFLSVAGDYIESGYLRPVLDLEVKGNLSQEEMSAWAVEWVETVKQETGVEPLIYTYYYFILEMFNESVFDYDLWIAYWTCDPTPTETVPPTGGFADWDFWQYQAPGGCGDFSIPGIVGNVDLNIFNGVEGDLSTFESYAPLWVSLRNYTYEASAPHYADLTADVNGSATGPINLAFWWDCDEVGTYIGETEQVCGVLPEPEEGTCVENKNGVMCSRGGNEVQVVEHTYQEIDVYVPKVIVERGNAPPAEDRYHISVINPLRSLRTNPSSPREEVINHPFTIEIITKIKTSKPGAVEVEMIEDGSWDVIYDSCVELGHDQGMTKRDYVTIESGEERTDNYTIWARYRLEGQCPVVDTDPDDRSLNYELGWVRLVLDKVGLYDPAYSTWYLKQENVGGWEDVTWFKFGPYQSQMVPISGDWDGDGFDTVGLYNPENSSFNLNFESDSDWDQVVWFQFGPEGDGRIPLVGDWDGDGMDTVGLYDPESSSWSLKAANVSGWEDVTWFRFGPENSGRIPIVGDWDGDGKDTVGLFDPLEGKWFLKPENTGGWEGVDMFRFGTAGENIVPITGDWNGDGFDTIGLYNPENSSFTLKPENSKGWDGVNWFKFGPDDKYRIPITGRW